MKASTFFSKRRTKLVILGIAWFILSGAEQGNSTSASRDDLFGAKTVTSPANRLQALPSVPKAQSFPPPGVLQFYGSRKCGDSDVSRFHQNHPNVAFFDSKATAAKLVLGYWVAPVDTTQGATDTQLPLSSPSVSGGHWIPIGYHRSLPVPTGSGSGTAVSTLSEINKAGSPTPADPMLARHLQYLLQSASQAYNMTHKSYNLYTAAMVCNQFLGSGDSPPVTNSLTAAEVVNWLTSYSNAQLASDVSKDTDGKYDLTVDSSGIALNVNIDGTAYDVSQNWLWNAGSQIGAATDSAALTGFTEPLLKIFKVMQNVQTATNTVSCSSLLSGISPENPGPSQGRWYEPYPLELTCKTLSSPTFLLAYQYLFNAQTGEYKAGPLDHEPTQSKLSQLAATLKTAGLMQHIQNTIAAPPAGSPLAAMKADLRCFESAQSPLYQSILASIVIPLTVSSGSVIPKNPSKMTHPEPDFAIGSYRNYEKYDSKTIFGMNTTGSIPSVNPTNPALGAKFTPGSSTDVPSVDPGTFLSTPISITFYMRSFGSGTCPIFCWLDRALRFEGTSQIE
jgi:hypothetical protein